MAFKLTYGTMHNPPQELHDNYEKRLQSKAQPGKEYRCLSTVKTAC